MSKKIRDFDYEVEHRATFVRFTCPDCGRRIISNKRYSKCFNKDCGSEFETVIKVGVMQTKGKGL